ncbi:hypothetical protein POF51_25860 [Brevibacillus sp. AG]|uniref:hypothetical protein n=1 Tax=Brevibacillus sp. AG TaxID=3020891 RepID=UPI00232C8CEA|nr:hypothetical protein [Brevibacillus sp. AG]MDC0764149.1 hypothetical protein [Brevibacillus sp. AG]
MLKESISNQLLYFFPQPEFYQVKVSNIGVGSTGVNLFDNTQDHTLLNSAQFQVLLSLVEELNEVIKFPKVMYGLEVDLANVDLIKKITIEASFDSLEEYKLVIARLTHLLESNSQIQVTVNRKGISFVGKIILPSRYIAIANNEDLCLHNKFMLFSYLPNHFDTNKRYYIDVLSGEITGFATVAIGDDIQ